MRDEPQEFKPGGSHMSSAFPAASPDHGLRATEGQVYLSGIGALVRLLLVQRWRDARAGLRTGGFVSGYRGSPLGGLDEALWKARGCLGEEGIKFLPGINEELAATAVWGTQQLQLTGGSELDGVFALWYGKAPGVDRCGDVFKHMSHAGTAAHGGVLLVAGDDHGAYSSTLPNQSDQLFIASMVPVLYPASLAEYIEFGLHGFAMSRYAGLPVAFKALADTVESSGPIDADPMRVRIRLPQDFAMPAGGVNCRASQATLGVQAREQELLMQEVKIHAVLAYARANRLNRVTWDAPRAKLGIAVAGKSHGDVMEALEGLGLADDAALRAAVRVFKIGMPWPLEPQSALEFARGLDEILVVEEKRPLIESQFRELLYSQDDARRPRIVGKHGDASDDAAARRPWLLPAMADLSVERVTRVIAARLARFHDSAAMRSRIALLDAADARLAGRPGAEARPAWYCAGCPHSSSTKVPEGSIALAGIGCHVMATAIYPEHNKTTTHMGGEGAPWLGQAWFSKRPHMFANLGDGTYYHSGSLAVRAAVAAGVSMTYKILYNDAVAMTGGQPVDGPIGVPQIAHQLAAEGVRRIALVAEDVSRWRDHAALPESRQLQLTLHARDEMDAVQRELREYEGVSVLIYDQVCAAEKRRRARTEPPPVAPRRAFINEAVCEACGDCGVQSNCTSLLPQATEYGQKRQIDQASCNSDTSCVDGFCPSFVTVDGVTPRKPAAVPASLPVELSRFQGGQLPEPLQVQPTQGDSDGVYNILVTGIGGTGVITVGALIGIAAHIEGKQVSVLDMTGMSQKNGAVSSHVRIAGGDAAVHSQRIPAGDADLLLGCDMLTAGADGSLSRLRPGRSRALINTFEQPSGHFAQQPDWQFPAATLRERIGSATADAVEFIDATTLARQLTGDAMAANIFLLGVAFQKGWLPVSAASLMQAIEVNGVAVAAGHTALRWGRLAALDLPAVARAAAPGRVVELQRPRSLAALLVQRSNELAAYQDAAYAARYRSLVERVARLERDRRGSDRLARAVATNLFKLMAYKDEYEVARLFVHSDFRERLQQSFEGTPRLRFHFAPPLWARRDAQGRTIKSSYGPWMWHALRGLAALRGLRGTLFDPFGRTTERREERRLIEDYVRSIEHVIARWDSVDEESALALARIPERIRGYGHIKRASIAAARVQWNALLAGMGAPLASPSPQPVLERVAIA